MVHLLKGEVLLDGTSKHSALARQRLHITPMDGMCNP